MKNIWVIKWIDEDFDSYVEVYDDYPFAKEHYTNDVKRISNRMELVDKSKEWEWRDFKFRSATFKRNDGKFGKLILTHDIIRERKNEV